MNQEVYKSFSAELHTRIEKGVFTTEDSVRYTFFLSLMKHTSLAPYDIVLEFPHNARESAKIDTYIQQYEGFEVVIEFKYNRAIPSGKNSPTPQKAGELFNDMNRLLDFKTSFPAIRLFVYLADNKMVSYMRNRRNKLADFLDLKTGKKIEIEQSFFTEKSKTFQKAARGTFSANIFCEWSDTLPMSQELRIYRIEESRVTTV